MRVALRPEASLQFQARPEGFLYDCHSRAFATLDGGAATSPGFTRLYLGLLFGVAPADWLRFLRGAFAELREMPAADRDGFVARYRPLRDVRKAVAMALAAMPDAGRFVELTGEADDPARLRSTSLWQENLALTSLEGRGSGQSWATLVSGAEGLDAGGRAAVARVLGRAASGRFAREELAERESPERSLVDALDREGLLGPAPQPLRIPPPGLYLTGHSSLLLRGVRTGVLLDPQLSSPVGGGRVGRLGAADLGPLVDLVAVTHGHFDHYHVPSLLQLGGRPLRVPRVPRASVVCEDLAGRLGSFGLGDVRSLEWGERLVVGDLAIDVLPFYGEQFLTSELYPEARNWGNCLVVEHDGIRALVLVDAGFEPGRSMIDVAAEWCATHGPIDVVAAQAIALRTAFGDGDPDLQITALTSMRRAPDAVELVRPEHRVTLHATDLPALCRATGARRVVLYGQFVFERGALPVRPAAIEKARAALTAAGSPAEVVPVRIGEGIGFTPGLPLVALGG